VLKVNLQSKSFKKQNILENINFDVKSSEITSIIGPSGCGKTTLLRIIASLDENYIGSVSFNDNDSIENLGFIFQDSRLLPWLSVKENILLVSKNKDEKKIEELLCIVGLKEHMYSYIKELSGGMKRRVSIVRAFINSPDVLLLDEPFISLDQPTAQVLRKLFFKFFSDYSPIGLFVTHDLDEALAISSRILFLSSNPSTIIYEYKNEPTFDKVEIALKRDKILGDYPSILSGSLS